MQDQKVYVWTSSVNPTIFLQMEIRRKKQERSQKSTHMLSNSKKQYQRNFKVHVFFWAYWMNHKVYLTMSNNLSNSFFHRGGRICECFEYFKHLPKNNNISK